MSDTHNPQHNTAGPLAFPSGGHYPAGWASPAEHERVERERVARELDEERQAADLADREAAIDARLTERRAAQEPQPAAEAKSEVKSEAA
jgi:hypothetical protein